MADEKYQTSLTGPQIDDALLQMNQRIPEGWAVGQRDGVDVDSSSQFYHNNAKYYAEQAAGANNETLRYRGQLTSSDDLFTATYPGFYRIRSNNIPSNMPQGASTTENYIGLLVKESGNYYGALWILVSYRQIWTTKRSGPNWGPWVSTQTPLANLSTASSVFDTDVFRVYGSDEQKVTAAVLLAYIKAALDADFDSEPTANSTNPVTSGGVYTALAGKQDALTFDDVPVSGSNNPVKSGGIYTKLSQKQNVLTYDDVPAGGSSRPVKSGGIYEYRVPMVGMGKQMLDNWYLYGPGDQGNVTSYGNRLPINQRGATTYAPGGFTIDRWYLHSDYENVSFVQEDHAGVTCWAIKNQESSGHYVYLKQAIPLAPELKGKKVTFSFLFEDVSGTGSPGMIQTGVQSANSTTFSDSVSTNINRARPMTTVTYTVPADTTEQYLGVEICVDGAHTIYPKAAKLELGEQQTLAHNEGTSDSPNWVLNEIPDYFGELAKCEVYFINYPRMTGTIIDSYYLYAPAGNYKSSTRYSVTATITTPQVMRSRQPTVNADVVFVRGTDSAGNAVQWVSNLAIEDNVAKRVGNSMNIVIQNLTQTQEAIPMFSVGLTAAFKTLSLSADVY